MKKAEEDHGHDCLTCGRVFQSGPTNYMCEGCPDNCPDCEKGITPMMQPDVFIGRDGFYYITEYWLNGSWDVFQVTGAYTIVRGVA